jgi:hypothetical protein
MGLIIQSLKDGNPRNQRRLWIAFVLLCVIAAAAAARRIVALSTMPLAGAPEFAKLDAHFAGMARMTLLHIVPSLLFVLLIPLQFVSSLRLRYPQVHRWIAVRRCAKVPTVGGMMAKIRRLPQCILNLPRRRWPRDFAPTAT